MTLEAQKQAGKPAKFIYTIPTVQNPTGGVMPVARRQELLDLAARYDCLIFEDDCYADLLWDGARPPPCARWMPRRHSPKAAPTA